jgi:hypothetical protein
MPGSILSMKKMCLGVDPSISSQFIECIVMAVAEIKTCNLRRMTMQKKVQKEDWVAMFRDIGMSATVIKFRE